MTPGDTKFSHITVHADDDDEFVIQAGASSAQDDAPVSVDPSIENAAPQAAPTEHKQADPSDAEQVSDAEHANSSNKYQPTTVEDLKAEPMSVTQKVVIVAAIVFIAGFIVYNVFMR